LVEKEGSVETDPRVIARDHASV